jgi:hypothetical protein
MESHIQQKHWFYFCLRCNSIFLGYFYMYSNSIDMYKGVIDFKPLDSHRCRLEPRQRHWFLTWMKTIQLAYGTSAVLLRYRGARVVFFPSVQLENRHMNFTMLVRRKAIHVQVFSIQPEFGWFPRDLRKVLFNRIIYGLFWFFFFNFRFIMKRNNFVLIGIVLVVYLLTILFVPEFLTHYSYSNANAGKHAYTGQVSSEQDQEHVISMLQRPQLYVITDFRLADILDSRKKFKIVKSQNKLMKMLCTRVISNQC